MSERFGHIIIDSPVARVPAAEPQTDRPEAEADTGIWQRVAIGRSERDQRLRDSLAPAEGEVYRLVRLADLSHQLGIEIEPGGGRRRDRDLLSQLGYQLARLDLRMGRSIIGKAIPKADETIPLYDSHYGEPPKRGTLPVGMFLAAWLVSADGVTPHDMEIIDSWITDNTGCPGEAVPAIATMRWLVSRRLILTAWRKARCASLARFVHRRASVVRLLLRLVADGASVSTARLTRLQTIYQLIGLDSADIHSDLHRMATEQSATVGSRQAPKSAAAVDRNRLHQMSADTACAQALLADVFGEDDVEISIPQEAASAESTLEVMRALSARAVWSLDDFRALCTDPRETTASMLERINDMSYEMVDEPLAEEDGDTVYVDLDVARSLKTKIIKN